MDVQLVLNEFLEDNPGYVGFALCEKCGGEVGPVSVDEFFALRSGKYGGILCFECEDFPPQPVKEFTKPIAKRIMKIYNVEDVLELPLSCNAYWTNRRRDVHLQLSKNFGWCFWLQSPDEIWQLRRVHLGNQAANELRVVYEMHPVMGK